MKRKYIMAALTLALCAILVESCTQDVSSRPHFIFKPAPAEGVVAQFMGERIKSDMLYQGVEQSLYEAEMAVYEIKLAKLKAHVLEKLVARETKDRGLTHDQFLNQVIAKDVKIVSGEIEEFVKSRGRTMKQISDVQKKGIERFLIQKKKKDAIEQWLSKKTAQNPVEVYLTKPIRPVFDVPIAGSPYSGGVDAKVVIAEFSDFQCQYCKQGAEFLKELKKKYGSKIKVVFKNYPLHFHNHAENAALAGLCAHEQAPGLFWKMHDEMFGNQDKLDKENLISMGKKIGLKMQDFTTCLESKKHLARVKADIEDGKKLGVGSTPTFFINGKLVAGMREREDFIRMIDEELK